jgi:hypothetical protein
MKLFSIAFGWKHALQKYEASLAYNYDRALIAMK